MTENRIELLLQIIARVKSNVAVGAGLDVWSRFRADVQEINARFQSETFCTSRQAIVERTVCDPILPRKENTL